MNGNQPAPVVRKPGLAGVPHPGAASIGVSMLRLEVTARTFFTVGHVNTDRMFPPFNVVGATVEIVGQGISATTNGVGVASLLTAAVPDGQQTIHLTPKSPMLSGVPAGFASQGTAAPFPDFEFRTLDVTVNFAGGQLTTPDPSVAAGIVYGDAYTTSPTKLKIDWKPDWIKSKNASSRGGSNTSFSMIVLHRTASSLGSTLNEFLNNQPDSAHYVVDVDGHAVKLVDESQQSFHADPGFWKGTRVINPISVGIEIINSVGEEYPQPQIDTVARILGSLEAAVPSSKHRVAGHSDVEVNRNAPMFGTSGNRALDPGPEFAWPALESQGLAPSCDPTSTSLASSSADYASYFNLFPNDSLQPGDKDAGQLYAGHTGRTQGLPSPLQVIASLQKDLSTFGYTINANDGTTVTGVYDAQTQKAVERFQRHVFSGTRRRTKALDGKLDIDTAKALVAGVASVTSP